MTNPPAKPDPPSLFPEISLETYVPDDRIALQALNLADGKDADYVARLTARLVRAGFNRRPG